MSNSVFFHCGYSRNQRGCPMSCRGRSTGTRVASKAGASAARIVDSGVSWGPRIDPSSRPSAKAAIECARNLFPNHWDQLLLSLSYFGLKGKGVKSLSVGHHTSPSKPTQPSAACPRLPVVRGRGGDTNASRITETFGISGTCATAEPGNWNRPCAASMPHKFLY